MGNFCQCQKRIKQLSPSLHKKIYGDVKKKQQQADAALKGIEDQTKGGKKGKKGGGAKTSGTGALTDPGTDRRALTEGQTGHSINQFTPREVLTAVENLAGKMLSRIVHAKGGADGGRKSSGKDAQRRRVTLMLTRDPPRRPNQCCKLLYVYFPV